MIPVSSPAAQKETVIGITERELRLYCKSNGYREFHGTQVFHWIYERFTEDFGEMTDLPLDLRKKLQSDFLLEYLQPAAQKMSRKKDAIKYGFLLDKDTVIESVVLWNKQNRTSFCISSQAGCPMGCLYCATGKMGFIRNLESAEIINEVVSLMKLHGKPDSVLFMGMGEPLLNYNHVEKALEFFTALDIGPRKVTVSSCGITDKIYKLAESGLRPRLAVSLGSAVEEKRNKLLPFSEKNDLERLGKAILYYRKITKRRVSLEYTLIRGLNDSVSDALALADFAHTTQTHVNLIRYNPHKKNGFSSPDTSSVQRFMGILLKSGIAVSERVRKGVDIHAACGQLASK
jgi:23S rRNA (adenine2503-C2)-methyltransferase